MKKQLKKVFLEELNAPNQRTILKNKIEIIRDADLPKLPFYKKFYKTRKRLVISLSSVLAVSLFIIVGSIMLVDYRNTPVYKGMYISTNETISNAYRRMEIRDREEIEELVEDEIDVIFNDGISYYASKMETILVTVQIDNPNFYEILSFTLNGKLYQTFEFMAGSNSEQIIVEFETSNASGIEEITIDAIKYVDDTTIKNARFNGTKTIQIAVLYENAPNVTDLVKMVDTTTFGLSFIARDTDQLIDIENSGLMLFLFDGTNLIEKSQLNLGRNVIPYSNLMMGHTYDYAIVGVYDLLDGNGKKAYVLNYDTFTTKEAFEFEINEVSYDYIDIDFKRNDEINGILMKVELISEGLIVDTIDDFKETIRFEGVDSDREYELQATYRYTRDVNGVYVPVDNLISTAVKTPIRPVPTLTYKEVTSNKTSIDFSYDIVDTTNLGFIKSTKLYLGELLVVEDTTGLTKFEGLLSNQTYRIEIDYQYDLKDGFGYHSLIKDYEITTKEMIVPTVIESNVFAGQETIAFDLNVEDEDELFELTSVDLLQEGLIVQTINADDIKNFSDLLSNNTYTVRVNYQYDLNDGTGIHLTDYSFIVKTLEKTVPEVKISNAVNFGEYIYVLFNVIDGDQVATILAVQLFENGVLVTEVTDEFNLITDSSNPSKINGDVSFNHLAVGSYVVVISYSYDLNDGKGVQLVNFDNRLSHTNSVGVDVN